MSVWRPVEIDAQPPTCAGVGVSNADSNHARTGAEKGASGSPPEARAFVVVGFVPRRAAGLVIALTGREFYSAPSISIRCSIRSQPGGRDGTGVDATGPGRKGP
jgi:hypothetical protein